ncbi:undecaprenyldiphospho-muramoylpentapeptide beta-N-acetylglucosaminyltransferase [Pseudohaliea rubra]|uniref:UDP-N-acetylglucosamine--N-acetylmuramyl-(pentapeptide) pyrophosphoryl-undecaprenol N-acetylglucosamine transferase n=1 Tax=Pseudohaliea rubra DSM 19751 TaxID=1265313 RepID=A0A095WXB9_9GAMM|nr:undecaprenyldiphospho-muramoylpentapeptide beta-N-acetylglucosaminyltransferase [Pseudohaliea rubra]KGE03259.1 Undecaprenyldiphospho-muramoylpentapeptide beta-N-acetylglucosaminyltransferase [Pseudohaliea rubra DSM 19751]
MSAAPLVMMLAGGTGGHVYPALAVAEELRERGYRVEWIGTRRGLEARVVPAAGIVLHCLAVRGLRGKSPIDTVRGVLALAVACVQALLLLLRRWPRCLVGMGGYASGPAAVVGWLLRRPLVLHEQNAVAGTTNRLLAPLAKVRVCGFPGAFVNRGDCAVTGNPVRAELVARAARAPWDYRGDRPLRLLVLGGSLGARALNGLFPATLEHLAAAGVAVELWHQCGPAHEQVMADRYAALGAAAPRCAPYIEDMAGAYGWADLVLCRAGALTVAELAVTGRPALLVPLPGAIDNHQYHNARFLAEQGAARLCPQDTLSPESVAAAIGELAGDPARLAAMAAAARGCGRPEAAAAVADRCEALL